MNEMKMNDTVKSSRKKKILICGILLCIGVILGGCTVTTRNAPPAHRPLVYTDGFPVLSINLEQQINWDASAYSLLFFRESWYAATLNISNTSADFEMDDVEIMARGRGNSTWWSFGEKRPIRFRFPNDEWQAIFDSPHVGRDWVMFANAADPSHLRNFSAYYLADLLGSFHFTPQIWFVHLYLDGDYRGVYAVVDEREAIEGRGNLMLDADPTVSEYMIEFDIRARLYGDTPVNTNWVEVRGPWDIRWPSTSEWMSEENNPHALYVEDFLTRVDHAILRGDQETLESLIDVETFIDYYLIHEFMRNQDTRWSSVFFQIRGQGENRRLYAGPIWDFDLSSGGTYYVESPIGSQAVQSYYGHSRMDWYYYLLNTDWFRELVRVRWNEIRDVEIVQMMDRVYYMATTFEADFARDYGRWPQQGNLTEAWHSSNATRALSGPLAQTEFLLSWMTERIEWMDDWLND